MMQTVHHLEKFPRFLQRAVVLNGLHAPDDPVHAALLHGNAADAQAAEALRLLHAIHRGFPEGRPVEEQAAYLVRAFAGLRPFAEANFRTGWDLMAETMEHRGRTLLATPTEIGELANRLWPLVQGMAAEAVGEADEAWELLSSWFRGRIA